MPRSKPEPAHILVVEDDRKTADLVALYLRHDGHRVSVAHAGSAALRRVEEEPFDLLVLDVMLPGVDGLEICRRVRARSATPISAAGDAHPDAGRLETVHGIEYRVVPDHPGGRP